MTKEEFTEVMQAFESVVRLLPKAQKKLAFSDVTCVEMALYRLYRQQAAPATVATKQGEK